ncbi:MAG TPA: nitroreductase family protein, partial [Dehalococcoidia bacterium]|nr:nitroreductase family protein [Dehalococcoidia bacterium]
FVVIRDAGVKQKLRTIYDEMVAQYLGGRPQTGQTPWTEVPVLIAVCTEGEGAGAMPPSIFPAVQNLLLAAHTLGLGSVLTTLWKAREADVKAVLKLPDAFEVHAILPIGYPDRQYGRGKRRPVSEVTYRDGYGTPW